MQATRHASDTKRPAETWRDGIAKHCSDRKQPRSGSEKLKDATKGRLGSIYTHNTHTYICMYTKGFFSSESRYGRNPSLDNIEAPALVGSKIGEKVKLCVRGEFFFCLEEIKQKLMKEKIPRAAVE